jgi:hypothetical protein
MTIPGDWRGRFFPRDPLREERACGPFPDSPQNVNVPVEGTAGRAERERDLVQQALARLNQRQTRA